ncbi:unnamed protein product [Adineta ricciae]|uniref:Uncharacterized protein n=1 Tax=Adineta ricciae TaxID=249248 RepID=A0A814T9Y4_ADIRI|nr:unnamed protein product [Adineta ricciae]
MLYKSSCSLPITMTVVGWLPFLSTAASYLGKLLGFDGPISIPATLAVYKFVYNPVGISSSNEQIHINYYSNY